MRVKQCAVNHQWVFTQPNQHLTTIIINTSKGQENPQAKKCVLIFEHIGACAYSGKCYFLMNGS